MTELNRTLAIRWFDEIWNKRMTSTIDELMATDAVGHMEGQDTHGREQFKEVRAALLGAFPDLALVVEDSICQGSHVVIRWRATGTHKGDQLGLLATNRSVVFRGMTWQTFKDGVLVEGWDAWNQGALLQSLQPA